MRYKMGKKTGLNTGSVIRPQYCSVNTSIAAQHIRLTNHVKQGNMRLAYSHEQRIDVIVVNRLPTYLSGDRLN